MSAKIVYTPHEGQNLNGAIVAMAEYARMVKGAVAEATFRGYSFSIDSPTLTEAERVRIIAGYVDFKRAEFATRQEQLIDKIIDSIAGSDRLDRDRDDWMKEARAEFGPLIEHLKTADQFMSTIN